jgi:hypothetical protein
VDNEAGLDISLLSGLKDFVERQDDQVFELWIEQAKQERRSS